MKKLLILTAILFTATRLPADEAADGGRRIVEKNQAAVVTVKAVLKISGSRQGNSFGPQESRVETSGTVLDPSGLTAVSYTIINPTAAIKASVRKQMAAHGGGMTGFELNCEVTGAKLILSDGTEVPAEIVLRDEDLDLAFLRPIEKPTQPMAAVPLSPAATPQLLDQVVMLNRLSSVVKRTIAVTIARVEAEIKKPRQLYSLTAATTTSPLGAPVFALDGKFIGLTLVRRNDNGEDSDSVIGGSQSGMLPVLMPIAELTDTIKQALVAPKPSAK